MVNGAVFIDKPSGITSMQALQRVKRLFRVKAGHTGTLDP
ncbi:MAG: tRNA pseudouridine(55) synthase TruB, partial [Aquificaceae bacterium]